MTAGNRGESTTNVGNRLISCRDMGKYLLAYSPGEFRRSMLRIGFDWRNLRHVAVASQIRAGCLVFTSTMRE